VGIAVQINTTHTVNGGDSQYGSTNLNVNDMADLSLSVPVGSGGTKQNLAVPVPANIQSVWIKVVGNVLASSTYTLTTWAELQGAQATQLDSLTLTDGVPICWSVGQGACPITSSTAIESIKLINASPNTNAAQLEIRFGYN
jgi:hypothetical protein